MSCSWAAKPDQEAGNTQDTSKSGHILGRLLNDTPHTYYEPSVKGHCDIPMRGSAMKSDRCIIAHLASIA
jgi:hypothetical protein